MEGASIKAGEQIRGMKVRSSVKKLCDGCKVGLYPLAFLRNLLEMAA